MLFKDSNKTFLTTKKNLLITNCSVSSYVQINRVTLPVYDASGWETSSAKHLSRIISGLEENTSIYII